MNVKRKQGFLARLLNPFAKVLSPIGLQNPSNRIASRPAGGAFITPAIYYSSCFLLRWRLLRWSSISPQRFRLPVHHQHVILPLGTNMKATSAPARSRCCNSYWLSGVNTILKSNQKLTNTQEGDYRKLPFDHLTKLQEDPLSKKSVTSSAFATIESHFPFSIFFLISFNDL